VLNQTAQIFDLTGVARVADSFAQLKAGYERNSAARAAMLSTATFKNRRFEFPDFGGTVDRRCRYSPRGKFDAK
jgi:hypothetical protein